MNRISMILFVLGCVVGGYAADPAPAAARQASDLLQTHDDAVKAADQKAIVGLKRLMTKYKKDIPTLTMLAVRLHKLDPTDADAIAVLKDVPPKEQDLLGEAGEPGKYMTEVQAKVIAEALAKGKFTGKEWDALPGKIIEANSQKRHEPLVCKKGMRMICVPHPDDKWKQNAESPLVKWTGENTPIAEMCLKFISEKEGAKIAGLKESVIQTAPWDGQCVIVPKEDAHPLRSGMIRVKVYEVVPNE